MCEIFYATYKGAQVVFSVENCLSTKGDVKINPRIIDPQNVPGEILLSDQDLEFPKSKNGEVREKIKRYFNLSVDRKSKTTKKNDQSSRAKKEAPKIIPDSETANCHYHGRPVIATVGSATVRPNGTILVKIKPGRRNNQTYPQAVSLDHLIFTSHGKKKEVKTKILMKHKKENTPKDALQKSISG